METQEGRGKRVWWWNLAGVMGILMYNWLDAEVGEVASKAQATLFMRHPGGKGECSTGARINQTDEFLLHFLYNRISQF